MKYKSMFLMFVVLVSVGFVNAGLFDDLNLYYDMENRSATAIGVTEVLFGNNNISDFFAQTTIIANGIIGTGLSTEGSQINYTTGFDSFNFSQGNKTMNFWVLTSAPILGRFLLDTHQNSSINCERFRMEFNSPNPRGVKIYGLTDSHLDITEDLFPNNIWRMFTFTFNDTGFQIYVNGSEIRQGNFDTDVFCSDPAAGSLKFSREYDTTSDISLQWDEMGFWNRSLTSSEVNALWNNGNALGFVDVINHTINIREPVGIINSLALGDNMTFGWNISGNSSDYISSCFLTYTGNEPNTINISKDTCISLNQSTFIYNGTNNISITITDVNDTNTTATTFFSIGFVELNQSIINESIETSKETFQINLTYDTNIYDSIDANLVYNGTSYIGSMTDYGSSVGFSREIDIPVITEQEVNVTYYWDVTVSNSTDTLNANSSIYNQTIEELIFTNCNDTYPFPVYVNYTIYIESNHSFYSSEFDAAFQYSIGGDLKENYTFSSSTNNYTYLFCTNKNESILVDSIINIDADKYDERTFTYSTENFTNISTTEKHLYLVNDSLARDVIVQVVDQGLQALSGYYVDIERYYPANNTFVTVISEETDVFGQFVANLIEDTVKYRFIFKNPSGTVVKTTDKVTIACRTTICVMQFVIEDTTDDFDRFNNITNFDHHLYFDNTTNIFSVSWNDVTGDASTMRLYVERIAINGTTIICNTSSILTSGTMNCSVGSSKASYIARFYRMVGDDEILQDIKSAKVGDVAVSVFGKEGLMWVFLLLFTLVAVGSFNPSIGVGLYIVGFIGMGLLGIISFTLPMMFANLVLVVLFIWAFKS